MTEPGASAARFSLRTVWTQNLQTPLRQFLRTETGSAAILFAATLAALAWANIDPSGYAATWRTELVIRSGTIGLADSWQGWVNSGLMAFFFLVAGLEARREFDMGERRERRRLALPLVVALGGMAVPIAIYLAINAGGWSASGWGAAMSTDTAFALGALALAGPGVPSIISCRVISDSWEVITLLSCVIVLISATPDNTISGPDAPAATDVWSKLTAHTYQLLNVRTIPTPPATTSKRGSGVRCRSRNLAAPPRLRGR